MSRPTRRKTLILCLLGLVAALAVFFLFTFNRLPRTHISPTLKFLAGYHPVRSTYKGQGYYYASRKSDRRREVVALVEEFELPMSLDEVHQRSRDELKGISYTAAYKRQSTPPEVVYGITDKAIGETVVIFMYAISPTRTLVVIKQPAQPGWLDNFFDRIRRGLGSR